MLGTKATIAPLVSKRAAGKLTIEFYSNEQFEGILGQAWLITSQRILNFAITQNLHYRMLLDVEGMEDSESPAIAI